MRSVFAALKSVLARGRFERAMRDELRAHIEHRADDLSASGLPREEAVRRARVEFGAMEAYKEQCRDESGFAPWRPMHGFLGDLKRAARRLASTPLFTVFAVLSIAVGVSVTTAAYAIVNAIFWQESGIPDPDTAVVMGSRGIVGPDPRWTLSKPDFADLLSAQRSFATVATSFAIHPAVETPTVTETRPAEGVDGAYFAAIGILPRLGRFLHADDMKPGAVPVAVIGHALWRTRFAEDPQIVGRTLRLDGYPFEVVGVAPEGFRGLSSEPSGMSLWISMAEAERLRFGTRPSTVDPRDRRQLSVFARLKPGISVAAASNEVAAIGSVLDTRHPLKTGIESGEPARLWIARGVQELNAFANEAGKFGALAVGLVALVLAVACTNLANLVLARGTTRTQEIAVRRALGASRWRLVREQLAESVVIGALAAAVTWPVLLVLQLALDIEIAVSRYWFVSIQPEVSVLSLAVMAGALLLAVAVFGLEPALALTRKSDVRQELASTSAIVGVPKLKRQRRLLRWQVAVSSGFFIIAALTVRYLAMEARHDSGMDLDRIAVAEASFRPQQWDETRARLTIDRILEAASRQPGVEAVAAASGLPFGTGITPPARLSHASEPDATKKPESAIAISVSTDFFEATGIAIRRGRAFDDRDQSGSSRVIVLSESTARQMFGTADVVGRQLTVQMDPERRGLGKNPPAALVTIAGIAEDTDTTHFMRRRGSIVYLPLTQEYAWMLSFVARAEHPSVALGALQAAPRQAAPEVGFARSGPGYTLLAGPHVFLRTLGLVAISLGAVTLLLAMVGLFGVQSHVVSHRTREIGVRMSFGATGAQIRRMVLKDGYGPVYQGLAIGMFIGIVGRAVIQSQTPVPIGIVDQWMFLFVPLPLLLAAFFACWLPAHRASRVDANVALRHL